MSKKILQYNVADSYLRLDPRTKLLLMLSVSFIMILGGTSGIMFCVRLTLIIIIFVLLSISQRSKYALSYGGLYLIAWYAEMYFIGKTSGFINYIATLFSIIVLRYMPCILTGYYLISTTRVSEFIAAMERMKISQKIIIPFAVMFRFFPTIYDESNSIKDAMHMRGIGYKSLITSPIVFFEYRVIPLLMSLVKIGDELTVAAITRGLGSPVKRTNIHKIGFSVWDILFVTISIIALICFILSQGGVL